MIFEYIIIVLAVLLSGFFSGIETGFVSCNKIRIHYRMEKGSAGARMVWSLIQNPHRVLATTLVGTNICVVIGSIVATYVCIKMFGENGLLIATCIMVPMNLIFGEVLPKTIYRTYSDKFVSLTAPVLLFFQKILFPIIILIEGITNIIMKGFRIKYTKKDLFITKEDIELLVRQITREGVLSRSEQGAIHQIFDFRYTRVGDIMVRLRDIISIDFTDDKRTIIDKARRSRFTRHPVLENKQIKGVLNIFDIFYNEGDWHKFIRPIRQVYANQRINHVLYQMQRNKELISAVVRKGKFIGIISLEDIIKEIELV